MLINYKKIQFFNYFIIYSSGNSEMLSETSIYQGLN